MQLRKRSRNPLIHRRTVFSIIILGLLISLTGSFPTTSSTAQVDTTATYIAEKYLCPPGFDPIQVAPQEAFGSCVLAGPGVSYTLESENPNYPGDTRETDRNGQVIWNDIPLGTSYVVTEKPPEGYGEAQRYCIYSQDPDDPNADVQEEYISAPDNAMNVGIDNPSQAKYLQVYCAWFNPSLNESQPPPSNGGQPVEGAGTVSVHKYVCPEAFSGTSLNDYLENCPQPLSGIPFRIIDETGAEGSTITTDATGYAEIGNVPAGEILIEETAQGFELRKVYCLASPLGSNPSGPEAYEEAALSTDVSGVQGVLPDDSFVDCWFFNMSIDEEQPPIDEEAARVSATKYECAADIDYQTVSHSELSEKCPPLPGVEMVLSHDGQRQSQVTDEFGRVFYGYISYGDVTITEAAASESRLVKVYCYFWETSTDPDGENLTNGNIGPERYEDIEINPDGRSIGGSLAQSVDCAFYNLATDDGEVPPTESGALVTVHKYLCHIEYDPSGEIPAASVESLLAAECTEPMAGVEISVTFGEGSVSETTDETGEVSLSHIPYGQLTIAEISSPEYQLAEIVCAVYPTGDPPTGYSARGVADDGRSVTGILSPGESVHCIFYNVIIEYGVTYSEATPRIDKSPGGNEGTAKVSIHKRVCPDNFNVVEAKPESWIEFCTEPLDEVQMSVHQSESEAEQATDSAGQAIFGEIPHGELTLTEEPMLKYELGRVECAIYEPGSAPTEYAEMPLNENGRSVTGTLQDGHLDCIFFNVLASD